MSWLNGHRNGHSHSHIDPATGRNKRDKSPLRTRATGKRGGGVPRANGKAVNRKAWRDSKVTGRPITQRKWRF